MDERELQLVRAFVLPAKRERYLGFLESPNRREKLLRELDHFPDLDPAFTVVLAGPLDSAKGVLDELRRRGATERCHLISSHSAFDGATMPLSEAVARVHGSSFGTLIGCIPGVLAYYEGESRGDRWILDARHRAPPR